MTWRGPVTRACLLLMEAMWIYALVAFFVAVVAVGGKPSFPAVAAVVFLSYGISRFLQDVHLSLRAMRIWGTVLSFLLFYAIVRIDFFGSWALWDFGWLLQVLNHTERAFSARVDADFGIAFLWLAWVRGVTRGQDRLGWEDILGNFGAGVLIVAFVELLQGTVSDVPQLVRQIAIPYAAVGLVSIGLAHSARVGRVAGRPFSFTWTTAVGGSIALIAAVAAILALVNVGTASGDASDKLATLASYIFYVAFWPIAQLTNVAFIVTRWFFELFGIQAQQPRGNTDAGQGLSCEQAKMAAGATADEARRLCTQAAHQLPDFVRVIVRVLVALPIIGGLLLMTALFFQRFQKRTRVGDARESTYKEGRLGQDISGLFGGLMRRLRPNLRLGRDHLDPVRRIYFEMLDAAADRGISRRPEQTPLELAPALEQGFHSPAPLTITDAFDAVRYGEHDFPDNEVRRLRQEWEQSRRSSGPG
jgi:hypothetical protein